MSKNSITEALRLFPGHRKGLVHIPTAFALFSLVTGQGSLLSGNEKKVGGDQQKNTTHLMMEMELLPDTAPITTTTQDIKAEIQKILNDPDKPIDDDLRVFLENVAQVATGSLLQEKVLPEPSNLPSEWLLFVEYIYRLEDIDINLQSVTKEGVFYFDVKNNTELNEAEDIKSIYNFTQDIPLIAKKVSSSKSLIGLSLIDLKEKAPALNDWLSKKINLDTSFEALPFGAYYKLQDSTITPTLPENLLEITEILPLTEPYEAAVTQNFPLVTKDLPVEILYKGGTPFYVPAPSSEIKKDVFWSQKDEQYYVFVEAEDSIESRTTSENVAYGSAFRLESFSHPDFKSTKNIDKNNVIEFQLPAGIECRDGYLCTPDGTVIVSWATHLPLKLKGETVFAVKEIDGKTEEVELGLFSGLQKLGLIGTIENGGKYQTLPANVDPTQFEDYVQTQVETTGNELLSEYVFDKTSFAPSEIEAVQALREVLPSAAEISPEMSFALFATEDNEHIPNIENGFYAADSGSLLSALMSFAQSFFDDQVMVVGGSTIIQQAAKNGFDPESASEQSITRKFDNMKYAKLLGENLSSEQIFSLYLEVLHKNGFGYLTESWFGVSPAELNFMQATLLAGNPQSPSLTSPTSYENVQRLLDRQETVLTLVGNNKLKTPEVLAQARTDAHLLLLPTPPETIEWLTQTLSNFSPEAARKVAFAAGDNFLESLEKAHVITPEEYEALIDAYYDQGIWKKKNASPSDLKNNSTAEYPVFLKNDRLTVENTPYNLFAAPLAVVRNEAGEPVVTEKGNILLWNREDRTYSELTEAGQLVSSDLVVIQNVETDSYVTILDYLFPDAEFLVNAEFDKDHVKYGSDGFAYWLSDNNEWFQVGKIAIHNNSGREIVLPISSEELAMIPVHGESNSPAAAAITSALNLAAYERGESPRITEAQILSVIQEKFVGTNPNEGAVERDGQWLMYPRAIQKVLKELGISTSVVETRDEKVFIDSMKNVLNESGAVVVLLGNEFQRKMPFYNVGTQSEVVLEAIPDNYQMVVVLDIIEGTDAEGNPETKILYVDPTRPASNNMLAEIIVATQQEFTEMAGQLGRYSLVTDTEVQQSPDSIYDPNSAEAQSRWFWQTNGVGITSLDGTSVVDRNAFIEKNSTLKAEFNERATEILKEAVLNRGAEGGIVVIMDAVSGKIDVMAGVNEKGELPTVNYATIPYVPGSAVKPISVLAAGNYGVDLTQQFPAGQSFTFPGTVFTIDNWSIGKQQEAKLMNAMQAVLRSNNPALVNIGIQTIEKAGDLNVLAKFYSQLEQATNGGVVAGLAEDPQAVLEHNEVLGEATMQYFGQRMQTDVITLLRWYAAMANNGQIPDMTVAKDVQQKRLSSLQEIFDPVKISQALEVDRTALNKVTQSGGTAPAFGNALEAQGARTFGKTGTAETGETTVSNATFVGWVEKDGKKKVFIVTLLQGGEGSTHASPIADQIMNEYFAYLATHPEENENDSLILVPTATPNEQILVPTATPIMTATVTAEPLTEIKLGSWQDVNRFYYGSVSDNEVVFGLTQETAKSYPLVQGIARVTDANGNSAFLVPENKFTHIILDTEFSKVPGPLADRFSSVQEIRDAYFGGGGQ